MIYIPDNELTDDLKTQSMINGYMYLIKGETITEAYERNQTEQIYYPFNTDEDIKTDDINSMLRYFERIEEFEKCLELKNLYDRINKQSNREIIKNEL